MNSLSALRSLWPAATRVPPPEMLPAGGSVQPGRPLKDLEGPGALQPLSAPNQTQAAGNFEHTLTNLVREVNAKQAEAGAAVNGVLSGQNVPLHQAMIAMEEASVSFQLMVEVRNKLLESYQELMRMQL